MTAMKGSFGVPKSSTRGSDGWRVGLTALSVVINGFAVLGGLSMPCFAGVIRPIPRG